jgi:hypothetical protein
MDWAQVDWLVEQGFYASRADFCSQLMDEQAPAPRQKVARKEWVLDINTSNGRSFVFKFSTVYAD